MLDKLMKKYISNLDLGPVSTFGGMDVVPPVFTCAGAHLGWDVYRGVGTNYK